MNFLPLGHFKIPPHYLQLIYWQTSTATDGNCCNQLFYINFSMLSYDLKRLDREILGFRNEVQKSVELLSSHILRRDLENLARHSELFCLFSFGNWKFENLPISIPLCIKMFFRPYIFVIQSKKVYRLSRTLIKIAFNSGENCFFAYFSIFSLVSQGRYLVKSHICGILWRK